MTHTQRTVFRDEDGTKFVVSGPKEKVDDFAWSHLHSSEIFPNKEYISDGTKDGSFTLTAIHKNKEKDLVVQTWTENQ